MTTFFGKYFDQNVNVIIQKDFIRSRMVKFFNKVKISKIQDNHLSQFKKKLLPGKATQNSQVLERFRKEYTRDSLFRMVSLFQRCKARNLEDLEKSVMSGHKRDMTSLSNSNTAQKNSGNPQATGHSFGMSDSQFLRSNRSLRNRKKSGTEDLIWQNLQMLRHKLRDIDNNSKKSFKFHALIQKRFKVSEKNKFGVENYVFKILDKAMLSLVLKLGLRPQHQHSRCVGRLTRPSQHGSLRVRRRAECEVFQEQIGQKPLF